MLTAQDLKQITMKALDGKTIQNLELERLIDSCRYRAQAGYFYWEGYILLTFPNLTFKFVKKQLESLGYKVTKSWGLVKIKW